MDSTAPTYAAVFADVARQLAGVAPSERGNVARAKNTAPPRYLWLWTGVTTEQKKGFNPTSSKTLGDEVHRVLIEIWAKTEDDAMAMRRALMTAGRASIGFDRFQVGDADVLEPWTDTDGIKLTAQVSIRLPAVDTFLPPTTPAATPGKSPSAVVKDATYPVQAVVDVVDDTPATSTAGDGVLEFTES
jgi:hypothetical protein